MSRQLIALTLAAALLSPQVLSIIGVVYTGPKVLDPYPENDTIYGTAGKFSHPAHLVARSIGTVTSDLLCAVSERVPRIYTY